MSESVNTGITHITASQNQKEVTCNEAFDRLSEMMTEGESIAITGDYTPDPTTVWRQNISWVLTGTPGAPFEFNVPNGPGYKKLFMIDNQTDSICTVIRSDSTGTTVAIQPWSAAVIFYDDTNVIRMAGASFDIPLFYAGLPGNSELVAQIVVPRAFTFKAGLPGSVGYARVAPTGSIVFTLKKNGTSIGTVNFAASSNTATFTFSSDVSFANGDRLTAEAPTSADATLEDISITLAGRRT